MDGVTAPHFRDRFREPENVNPPWLELPFAHFAEALAGGRLAHAWLLGGPRGLGKRVLAKRIAASVLCQRRLVTGDACGTCRGCQLRLAGTHPDFHPLGLESNDRGGLRTEIVIDQVRALCERLAQTSHAGGYRLAIIDPADALNPNSANALLKTLEEPPPDVVMMLVANEPSRLLPTLRSRCRRLDVRLPVRAQAAEWLATQTVDAAAAVRALDLASGNPGEAFELVLGNVAVEAVLDELLSVKRGRASAVSVARRWLGDDAAPLRLAAVSQWLRLAMFARAGSTGEADARLQDLTEGLDVAQLSHRVDQLGRLRSRLQAPLRHELLVLHWLRQWKPRVDHARNSRSRRHA